MVKEIELDFIGTYLTISVYVYIVIFYVSTGTYIHTCIYVSTHKCLRTYLSTCPFSFTYDNRTFLG